MGIVLLVIAALAVVAIALVAVGRASSRMEAAPPGTVFDLDEAVIWVADRLPREAQAQLSYDDVRRLIGFELDYLEAKGVAAEAGDVPPVYEPDFASGGPVVTDDDEGLAYVLGEAGAAGLDLADEHVAEVVECVLGYLAAIGAVGKRVDPPGDPAA